MFIIVLRQHVSIRTESSSGPSKIQILTQQFKKMRCGIPNAYILDKTMYKMHAKRHMHFIHRYVYNSPTEAL